MKVNTYFAQEFQCLYKNTDTGGVRICSWVRMWNRKWVLRRSRDKEKKKRNDVERRRRRKREDAVLSRQ